MMSISSSHPSPNPFFTHSVAEKLMTPIISFGRRVNLSLNIRLVVNWSLFLLCNLKTKFIFCFRLFLWCFVSYGSSFLVQSLFNIDSCASVLCWTIVINIFHNTNKYFTVLLFLIWYQEQDLDPGVTCLWCLLPTHLLTPFFSQSVA